MADQTLTELTSIVTATEREVNDLTVQISGFEARISTNESDIAALQSPPVGVPPELLAWLAVPHTLTEVDSTLNTTVTGLSTSIGTHTTQIAQLQSDLSSEVTNRGTADTTLQANINALQVQVTANLATLTQEITDRSALSVSMANQYDTINSRIDSVQSEIDSLTTSSGTLDSAMTSQIATINSALQTLNTQVLLLQNIGVDPLGAQASQITALTTLANDASNGLAAEITNRSGADSLLQASINALSTSFSGVQADINTEKANRIAADSALNASFSTLSTTVAGNTGAIAAETAARTAADSTINSTLSTHTTNIADNAAAISAETTARGTADTALQGQITTNTGNIATNTANIATNTTDITNVKSRFSVVKDGSGYVTDYRIIDQSLSAASFKLRNLNNDSRLQNPGYVGKYFAQTAMSAFSPPVTYSTLWGGVTTNDFHGTNGNDYTRNVLVYATASVGLNGSVFMGVDYSTGGSLQRLGQVLTTFRVDFSGAVNRYLSLWYRLKATPGNNTGRWQPVALADNTMSGQRTYEQTRGQAVVQISVTANQVIEFGLTVLNTLDATIADATKDVIYGGSVSIVALNMVTIS